MTYTPEQRAELLDVAEEAIRQGVRGGAFDLDRLGEWARTPRATFVTVYLDGELNGCIGTLEARRSIASDIANNAQRAAFDDPRFPAIEARDLQDVTVHVAILGPLTPINVASEAELLPQLRVGVDGIVLADGERRGTFLPAVWEKIPEPAEFIARLKQKAGIREEWPESMQVFRFEVEEFDRTDLQQD